MRLPLLLPVLVLLAACSCLSAPDCRPCDLVIRQAGGKLHAVRHTSSSFAASPSPNIVWARDRLEVSVLAVVPVPDSVKARAVGYAEGHVQARRVFDYWSNYRMNEFATQDHRPTKVLLGFIDQQDAFVRSRIQAHRQKQQQQPGQQQQQRQPSAPVLCTLSATTSGGADGLGGERVAAAAAGDPEHYWELMGLVMDQFDGFCEGFWESTTPERNMTYQELYLLQSVGDLYDLKVVFPQRDEPEPEPSVAGSGSGSARRRDYQPGHGVVGEGGYGSGEMLECSALIKLHHRGEEPAQQQPQQQRREVVGRGGRDARESSVRAGVEERQVVSSRRRAARRQLRAHGGTRGAPAADGWQALHQRRTEGDDDGSWKRGRGVNGVSAVSDVAFAATAAGSGPAGDDKPKTEFIAGHATWRPYYAMVRTWKVYELPWSQTGPITVSSSPGLVGYSKDDWYTTDRFVVLETTNGIYNASLYDAIRPETALMWQRVQVANMGARTGAEWAALFAQHNSGTYNNQWMVLDVPRLAKGKDSDVLWVLEQLPGSCEAADVTSVLQMQGYWASYNVPYFPRVYNTSGYPADKDVYHGCARAKLFAREQGGVGSVPDMRKLLRLNRYQEDPLSEGSPTNAIAARYDLDPERESAAAANWTRRAFGAVDAKVVDSWGFAQQLTHAISGPTDDDQPTFSWSSFCGDDPDDPQEVLRVDPWLAHTGGSVAEGLKRRAVGGGRQQQQLVRAGAKGPSGRRAAGYAGGCDNHNVSIVGLVDRFDFGWQLMQASLPWLRRYGSAEAVQK